MTLYVLLSAPVVPAGGIAKLCVCVESVWKVCGECGESAGRVLVFEWPLSLVSSDLGIDVRLNF